MKPKYLWWGALALVVVIGGGMAAAVSCWFCAPPSSALPLIVAGSGFALAVAYLLKGLLRRSPEGG